MDIYAYYIGDKFITVGTLDEVAEVMGTQKDTIKYYTYPVGIKRESGKDYSKRRIVIKWKELENA